jgi:DNA topoisomerase I
MTTANKFINYIKKGVVNPDEIQTDDKGLKPEDFAGVNEVVLRPTSYRGEKIAAVVKDRDFLHKISAGFESGDTVYTVVDISTSKQSIKPKPPFTTSTLQQAASSKLGMPPKSTMRLAQQLYEGVDISGSNQALITYMRTDSVMLSADSVVAVNGYVERFYPEFKSESPRLYKSKKSAQEAHEAIRPTNVMLDPAQLKGKLEAKLFKLYELIWRQTVACQMKDEVREITTFELENSEKSTFTGSHTQTIFMGWKAVMKD